MKSLKKVLIPTAVLLFSATLSQAQLGVKAGVGMYSAHGDKAVESFYDASVVSPMVGLTYHVSLPLLPIALKPEVMLIRKGAASTKAPNSTLTGTVDAQRTLWYVDAPLLGSFSFFPTLSLIAGPSVGYFLTGTDTYDGSSTKSKDIAKINVGGVIGIQFMTPILGLGVDARYQRGFTTIIDNVNNQKMMLDGFAVTGTYLF